MEARAEECVDLLLTLPGAHARHADSAETLVKMCTRPLLEGGTYSQRSCRV